MSQRIYKFTLQGAVQRELSYHFSDYSSRLVGPRRAKAYLEGLAGGIVGLGEAVLLVPVDALRVRAQTNPAALEGKSLFVVFSEQGRHCRVTHFVFCMH